MGYCFWLKNTMHYYERHYKRIQDLFSSIGGIYQVITIIAIYINSLYNNYIVLIDTKNLLNFSIHTEKNIHIKKENDIYKNNNKNKNIIKSSDRDKYITENTNKSKKIQNEKNASSNYLNRPGNNENNKINSIFKEKTEKINNENLKKDIDNKKKENYNFLIFLLFKLSCKKKDNCFKIYNRFRKKIISEDHLIKNHLNIYNLLKLSEKKRSFRRNSYRLSDLIKLV